MSNPFVLSRGRGHAVLRSIEASARICLAPLCPIAVVEDWVVLASYEANGSRLGVTEKPPSLILITIHMKVFSRMRI